MEGGPTFNQVHGPIIGDCTDTSAIIWYRDEEGIEKPPELTYWPTGYPESDTTTVIIKVDPAADFTSSTKLHQLLPDTRYSFQIGNKEGSFRTPGSSSFSFQFGTCIGGQGFGRYAPTSPDGEGYRIFKAMRSLQPDFFLFNGDSIYADDEIEAEGTMMWNKGEKFVTLDGARKMTTLSTLDEFRSRYKYNLDDPVLAEFLKHCPVFVNWDDHEVMDNFGQEQLILLGKKHLFDNGIRAFTEFWPIATPPQEPQRIYRNFTWGPHAELFILDCRSYRAVHKLKEGNVTPTMDYILGEKQLQWLLSGLSTSTRTWKFIASSVPLSYPTGWPTPEKDGYDGWSDGVWGSEAGGPEVELEKVLKHISDEKIHNVIFLAGDVHFPYALSYDPFDKGSPLFYELGCSPLQALCLPPAEKGPDDTFNPSILYAEGSFAGDLYNFGHVVIDETGKLEFSIRGTKGDSMYNLTLNPNDR